MRTSYSFPWLRYRVSAPARGYEYLAQLNFVPDRKTEWHVRYRTENKPLNVSTAAGIDHPAGVLRQNLRLHFSKQLTPDLGVKTRVDLVWWNKKQPGGEEGFVAYADVDYRLTARFSANARLLWFETGGYNSRIYAYESDVLYGFSIPAFFDTGMRCYLNFSARMGQVRGWVKWGQSVYRGKSDIGSGADAIAGNRRSEIKLQVMYSF